MYVFPSRTPKISKEDIFIATELAQAADEAGATIRKRQLRKLWMDRCAKDVEKMCRNRTQHHQGGVGETISSRTLPRASLRE